jgi:hypothetical protein
MKSLFTVIFFIAVLPFCIFADTINVPADTSTIQGGISLATNGDIVLVADGTYYENINFKGKAITVASHFWMDGDTSHISATIINGSQRSHPDSGSVVYFISGEDTTSVLYGLTITGGTGTVAFAGGPNLARVGGGIFINNSNAKISDNIIFNNTVADSFGVIGGGLTVFPPFSNTFVIVENNTFDSNSCVRGEVASHSGGMFVTNKARICKNIFRNNFVSSNYGEAFGGGFTVAFTLDYILIYDNTIINNKVETLYGTGIYDGALGGGCMIWNDITAFVRIMNNNISNNEVSSSMWSAGAGICFEDVEGDVVFANNRVYDNFYSGTVDCYGTGIGIQDNTVLNIINNTITDNEASPNGGALSVWNTISTKLENNILWGNSSGSLFPEIGIWAGIAPEVLYCDIQDSIWPGTGNINADPLFADTLYQLSAGSPCIDAGNPDPIYNDPDGSRNDMGAYGGPGIVDGIEKNEIANPPAQYFLNQNYPNPFNPITTIEFSIPKTEFVTIKIFNLLGQKVVTLVSDKLNSGNYKYTWDASCFASGIYYYKIEAGSFIQTKKLILLK